MNGGWRYLVTTYISGMVMDVMVILLVVEKHVSILV